MLRYIRKYIGIIVSAAWVGALLSGCGSRSAAERDSRMLSVSIEPQRYLLERIAGPKWKVNTVLGKGEDPEGFDPSMSSLRDMHDSRAYFKVGTMAFEEKLTSGLLEGVSVYDTSEGIEPLVGTHGDCNHHGADTNEGHEGETDPHIWASLRNARRMAMNMLTAMIEIDPADSVVYRENWQRLDASLDSCDRVVALRLKPMKGKAFMVWHPSLSYFARDYGLRQLSMGLDNKEMSAMDFRRKIDEAKAAGVSLFLVQPDFDAGRSSSVADAAGANKATVNTLTYDLPEELLRISLLISQSK